jgi:hypothetical protein
MSSDLAMSLAGGAEFVLTVVLTFLFWRKRLHRRFPALGAYLALRVTSTPVLLLLFSGDKVLPSQMWLIGYFFVYWAVYIASAGLMFCVCMEVFRSVLSSFSGLTKFGILIFRWAVLASVIVSLSTLSFAHRGLLVIPDIAYGLMRSVSIIELCLLGFLCLSMNALRLSVRDAAFGIAMGFGLMSANDFVHSLLVSRATSLSAPVQFFYESVILIALGVWVAYFALPEPVSEPVLIAVNSTIYRWNEIASALGHTGTRVAVRKPETAFLLTDVERAVERALTRRLKDRKSET